MDYAATTPVDPRVKEAMLECLDIEGIFGNPASGEHMYGLAAAVKIDEARKNILALIHASDAREIIFTSGATESNNLAIKGALLACSNKRDEKSLKPHIITSQLEHKAVLDVCAYLESRGDCEVTYLPPNKSGIVSVDLIQEAIQVNTVLVSLMMVNNETGIINPCKEIGQLLRSRSIIFHVDAAQAVGKMPINVEEMQVDLLSISAHKMYGPKGVGALYVRRRPKIKLIAQMHGGGHEFGLRSGTLATHQIVGFSEAAKIAAEMLEETQKNNHAFRKQIIDCLKDLMMDEHVHIKIHINEALKREFQYPGILSVTFYDIDGEALRMALPCAAISSGSACTSSAIGPSHVLLGLGLSNLDAHNTLRFSFGRFLSTKDVGIVVDALAEAVKKLSAMAGFYDHNL